MNNTLLDISDSLDPHTRSVLQTIASCMQQLELPYVVVGAMARDLVLYHAFGMPVQRATKDMDFALEVPDWLTFENAREALQQEGFKATRIIHRLQNVAGDTIDLIPFGGVAGAGHQLSWPPDYQIYMNLLGFKEAAQHALAIRIQRLPEVIVPVASPEGLLLLKLLAWMDRAGSTRHKDAQDLQYLLSTHEQLPRVKETLYQTQHTPIMQRYDWDLTLAAAHLLGQQANLIATEDTRQQIERLAREQQHLDQLVYGMCGADTDQYARCRRLLHACMAGLIPT